MLDLKDIQTNVVLAEHTTYKIGGPADYFYIARTKQELVDSIILARKENIPYFILGSGANVLVGDKGFRGLVIKNQANKVVFYENTVVTDSGVIVADLIKITLEKELSGFEHFAGIPSTIGGALWQNLHFLSPDRQSTIFIESILHSAEILDEDNTLRKVGMDFFKFGYDYSILRDTNIIVTEATFKLKPEDKTNIQKIIEQNLRWRNEKQPQLVDFPSCGSVFKNIEGVGAGRLIEKAGLKGHKIGGAQISEKHANYIVNTGNATAKNVLAMINLIKEKVKSETGHELQTEINLVGEF